MPLAPWSLDARSAADQIHEDHNGDDKADFIHEDVDHDGTLDLVHEDVDGAPDPTPNTSPSPQLCPLPSP